MAEAARLMMTIFAGHGLVANRHSKLSYPISTRQQQHNFSTIDRKTLSISKTNEIGRLTDHHLRRAVVTTSRRQGTTKK